MARDPTKRRLFLDLTEVADLTDAAPDVEVKTVQSERALTLIQSVMQHGPLAQDLDADYLVKVTAEDFEAAHAIVEGGEGNIAYRIASESLSDSAFSQFIEAFAKLRAIPDPSLASEFI